MQIGRWLFGAVVAGALLLGCDDDTGEEYAEDTIEQAAEREAARRGADPIDRQIIGEYAERRGELELEAGNGIRSSERDMIDDAILAGENGPAAAAADGQREAGN